jgi:ribosome modulation factor
MPGVPRGASVHSKTRSSRAPSGNSRVRSSSSTSARTTSSRRSRDPLERAHQRGLKGQPFEAPFDPDLEPEWRTAWEAGRDERKRQHGKTDRKNKGAATRKKVRARARKAKGYYRRGTKNLRNPVRQQLTSGSQVFVLTLAVVALYLALQTADKVAGFVGGLSTAVKWLADPLASIPHKPSLADAVAGGATPAPTTGGGGGGGSGGY